MATTPHDFERDISAAGAADTLGLAEDHRRLADMILAAFNHAYGIGAPEIADRLWSLLAEVENRFAADQMGRAGNTVHQAERWVEFVEARNRYREALDSPEGGAQLEQTFLAMKAAYRRWSDT